LSSERNDLSFCGQGVTIRLTPWSIYLKPASGLKIPGIHVNRITGWGRLPLTPFICRIVAEALEDIPEEVRRLALATEFMESYRRQSQDPTLPDPPGKTSWWSHQKQAFYLFKQMFDAGYRGVGLFSALGTGKSKVAIGLADALQADMILCVGPRSASLVWHREFRKHADRNYQIVLPDMSVSVEERLRRIQLRFRHTRLPKVAIVNYDAVWRPPLGNWILDQAWDLVIADEVHRIKTPKSQISLFMARLRDRAKYRMGLTGTPLHHRPLDIWAVYRFLDPGVYGMDYWSFRHRYSSVRNTQGPEQYQHEQEFSEKLYSIAFRAGEEVLRLPETVHQYVYGELRESAKVYNQIERAVIAEIKAGRVTIHNALVRLVRLQQVTSGHIRDDKHRLIVVGTEKEDLFADLLTDLPDEPFVVFCQFTYDLERVEALVMKSKRSYAEYSGQRDELAVWRSGKKDVLGVQIRTGATSEDFTRARYAIYYSFGLSLGDYEQSLKRVHRAGQTRPVTYIHLLLENTIDQRKMKFLEARADLIQGLLDEYLHSR